MKNFKRIKTFQLILFIVYAIVSLVVLFTDPEIYHLAGTNLHVRILCFLLWSVVGVSYLFIFWDLSFISSYRKDYRELDFAVHSDPLAGIANRYSCDILISKYQGKPLPGDIGCIMLELTNLAEINRLYGHLKGDEVIRDFSNILKLTSVDLCFVGRNGGNKFLAVFESSTPEQLEVFLTRVAQKIRAHNSNSENPPLEYSYGTAFSGTDGVETITDLISLSNANIANISL
ncbi:MAG: GGDEF domain-containing protein [Lachnospiraceae bacterium]|nr:GGDEF domain-containing protein [Lachnospiraceae bacterium]